MSGPDEFPVYGDRVRAAPQPSAAPAAPPGSAGSEVPACPACGSTDFEEGFVEGTSDSLVRYFGAPREMGFLGVRRFGLDRRPVLARRCLGCSRLDLYAPDVD